MARQIGVGVVGLDHWYTAFGVVEQAARGQGARLVAVADKSRKRLGEATAKHKAGYVTTDFEKVIGDPNVDLVCSLANTRDSVAVTREALKAGKHVACVKPMAMTLRQADALIALAEKQNRVLWSFDQLGRGRANAELKSLLKRGAIGEPLSLFQTMWSGLPKPWPGKTGPSWWTDPKRAPFGAWADHGIYTIDMLRFLFEAEVEVVHGEIGNLVYPDLKVEDYGLATVRFSNGVVAVIEDTWTATGFWPHWTKFVGTKGVIHIERGAYGDQPVLATAKGVKPIKLGQRGGGLLDPMLALVRKGAAKPSPARESRTNLAIAFAVYRSAATGRYVRM